MPLCWVRNSSLMEAWRALGAQARSKTCTQVDANPGSAACSDAVSGSRQKRGARIPNVGGHRRNVARARAITTHGFGLWADDGQTRSWLPRGDCQFRMKGR